MSRIPVRIIFNFLEIGNPYPVRCDVRHQERVDDDVVRGGGVRSEPQGGGGEGEPREGHHEVAREWGALHGGTSGAQALHVRLRYAKRAFTRTDRSLRWSTTLCSQVASVRRAKASFVCDPCTLRLVFFIFG